MQSRMHVLTVAALLAVPAALAAQAGGAAPAQSANPVSDAFRQTVHRYATILPAAAEAMPEDKYGYKPTPAQMSWKAIQVHLIEGNDFFCAKISGAEAPKRTAIDTTASKAALVARLKETFDFCESAMAKLDDSKLGEMMPLFGSRPASRAAAILITVGDWADHYSQEANYLRLNGLLPPTAQRRQM